MFRDFQEMFRSAPSGVRLGIRLLAAVALLLVALQVGSAAVSYWAMGQSLSEASHLAGSAIDVGKKREELIAAASANFAKRFPLDLLATGLGAVATVVIAISGGVIALQQYMDGREKDRLDRQSAQQKELDARASERLDRLAAELKGTLEGLASTDARRKTVAVAGVQHFFGADKTDFHLQALAVLIAAMRTELEPQPGERDEALLRNMALALSQAARLVATDVLRQCSWRALALHDVDLSGLDLTGLDLREADLENARLRGTTLKNADLTKAVLKGADLTEAHLEGAVLSYADFAGADLTGAALSHAWIDGAGMKNANLAKANLADIRGDWRSIPWDYAIDWRSATFSGPVRAELDDRFGPEATGPHVVMLMWESPPLVAGGAWTACYHMVRNLRRQGAKITVVTPWRRDAVLDAPFGGEVPLVALGIEPPADDTGAYGAAYGASYARMISVYGSSVPLWSGYGGGGAVWSGYSSYAGAYGRATSAYGEASPSGSALLRLVGEFTRVLTTRIADLKPDLIHAHDWVTFGAAEAAARAASVPWIAHVHSTEAERRPDAPDAVIERIERRLLRNAIRIITPSEVTRRSVVETAGVPPERVTVVPNMLSGGAPPLRETGRFETRRVIFLGRLTRQKGLDRFAAVAARVAPTFFGSTFDVFGDGEDRGPIEQGRFPVNFKGPIGWDRRGDAFAGAAVLIAPSRAEPFGMVVLEAMQHRVPVIYPSASGAAEVLSAGVQIDPDDVDAMSMAVARLLRDWSYWEDMVEAQAQEIAAYPNRPYPQQIMAAWRAALALPRP